jgi:carbon monoxide dehydrogenase subunit G
MPELSQQVTIPSPPDFVWPLLADPMLVVTCIPGATLTVSEVAGVYTGTVRVNFGPAVAVFRGEARLAYDHAARYCTVEGRGIDARNQSRVTASGLVSADAGDGDTTVLTIEGSFTVTGPLEAVANAGGAGAARALLAEFAANMARILTAEGTPAPEAEEIPIVEPQSVSQQARAAVASPSLASPMPPDAGGPSRSFLGFLRQVFSGKR